MVKVIYDPPPDSRLVGVIRAIRGISDAHIIVHGRSCCHADTLLLQTLTSCQNDIRLSGSGIRAQDISTGGDRKLSLAIKSVYQEFNPELIAILVASVPTLMGDDVEGLVAKIAGTIPAEIVTFPCAGYAGRAAQGYEEALASFTQFMVSGDVLPEKVNLLGFKVDEPGARANLREIKRMLGFLNCEVQAVFSAACFQEIKDAPRAALNIVLGGDGLVLARTMEKKFGIPYQITPYPFGWEASLKFLKKVAEKLGKEISQDILFQEKEEIKKRISEVYAYLQGIYGMPVAVVGEEGRAFDLARFLSVELGFEVKLLAITSQNFLSKEGRREGSFFEELLYVPDYMEISEKIKAKGVKLIFGSTWDKKLASEMNIPLVRTSFPVLDAVFIADLPYVGFRGTVNLIEKIINAIIGSCPRKRSFTP